LLSSRQVPNNNIDSHLRRIRVVPESSFRVMS
jgi:hypothetical protein